MEIKGHQFGTTPIICVPVVERTAEEILNTIKAMTGQGAAMIEWRMDWFEEAGNCEAVLELLAEIAPYIRETVFLCTYRTKGQGGQGKLSEETYLILNQQVAQNGVADLVDLEYFEISQSRQAIEQMKQAGARVICSNHNFLFTPSIEEMERQFQAMLAAGADFAKLAVMPKRKGDVLHLMEAVLRVKEQHPDSHLIAMSMGGDGGISRLLGGWFGSEVTFAAFGKASAPGQMDCRKVQALVEQIEEGIR